MFPEITRALPSRLPIQNPSELSSTTSIALHYYHYCRKYVSQFMSIHATISVASILISNSGWCLQLLFVLDMLMLRSLKWQKMSQEK